MNRAKAGSADMDATWALARHAFAEQLVRQLRKGRLRKRDRKSTHASELLIHPSLKGAYAVLMGCADGEGAVAAP